MLNHHKRKIEDILLILREDFITPYDLDLFDPNWPNYRFIPGEWAQFLSSFNNSKETEHLLNQKGMVFIPREDERIIDIDYYLHLTFRSFRLDNTDNTGSEDRLKIIGVDVCRKLLENKIKFEWDFNPYRPILVNLLTSYLP